MCFYRTQPPSIRHPWLNDGLFEHRVQTLLMSRRTSRTSKFQTYIYYGNSILTYIYKNYLIAHTYNISSGICHDSIITHLICCLAYLMFLVCAKYLNIVIHLDLSQCLDDNLEPLGQAVDFNVEVVSSHRLFCRTGHD